MPQLEITDRLIADLIEQIAPLVAQATGWDLKPADLRTRGAKKSRL